LLTLLETVDCVEADGVRAEEGLLELELEESCVAALLLALDFVYVVLADLAAETQVVDPEEHDRQECALENGPEDQVVLVDAPHSQGVVDVDGHEEDYVGEEEEEEEE